MLLLVVIEDIVVETLQETGTKYNKNHLLCQAMAEEIWGPNASFQDDIVLHDHFHSQGMKEVPMTTGKQLELWPSANVRT